MRSLWYKSSQIANNAHFSAPRLMPLVTYYAIIMMVATWLGLDVEASWSKLAATVE